MLDLVQAQPGMTAGGAERRIAPTLELGAVMLAAWAVLAGSAWMRGELAISWDMLNHHVYIGWEAFRPRFDLDVLPAATQTYQYPYLYWPVYALVTNGFSGRAAGAILATLQLVLVPPIWMAARACIPEAGWYECGMRCMAVALGLSSAVGLSLLNSTTNDMLAAAPLLWAIALSLPATRGGALGWPVVSGLLAGLSIACKWSNGPLVLVLPLLWWFAPAQETLFHRGRRTLVACVAVIAGFSIAYAPWGWQLWTHFRNPFHPMFADWIAILRGWLQW
jgi:hypothetical protein